MMKRTVLLGVTGSIAAYKMADVASNLTKNGVNVYVIMTKNATKFVSPIVFSTLTGNKCYVDTFDDEGEINVPHVNLAKMADLIMVAPASANMIAKIANGIADDMLSTTIVAFNGIKMISPAMNTNMYNNPIVQDNLARLADYGWETIEPGSGILACKDDGKGKLPKVEVLLEHIYREIKFEHDLAGKKILISAGGTQEAIDPVRFISNHSSGKMGYALARNAMQRGAEVVLVSANVSLEAIPFVTTINVTSAKEMSEVVKQESQDCDVVVMAAAVGDYRPVNYVDHKIKKSESDQELQLERTEDILSYLGHHKQEGQYICGFSMETNDLIENSTKKLNKKKADLIVANNLFVPGAGFQSDTNVVTLISHDAVVELDIDTKDSIAAAIFNFIKEQL